jgi:hypothetical protein
MRIYSTTSVLRISFTKSVRNFDIFNFQTIKNQNIIDRKNKESITHMNYELWHVMLNQVLSPVV